MKRSIILILFLTSTFSWAQGLSNLIPSNMIKEKSIKLISEYDDSISEPPTVFHFYTNGLLKRRFFPIDKKSIRTDLLDSNHCGDYYFHSSTYVYDGSGQLFTTAQTSYGLLDKDILIDHFYKVDGKDSVNIISYSTITGKQSVRKDYSAVPFDTVRSSSSEIKIFSSSGNFITSCETLKINKGDSIVCTDTISGGVNCCVRYTYKVIDKSNLISNGTVLIDLAGSTTIHTRISYNLLGVPEKGMEIRTFNSTKKVKTKTLKVEFFKNKSG